jgi:hypothetical protein
LSCKKYALESSELLAGHAALVDTMHRSMKQAGWLDGVQIKHGQSSEVKKFLSSGNTFWKSVDLVSKRKTLIIELTSGWSIINIEILKRHMLIKNLECI